MARFYSKRDVEGWWWVRDERPWVQDTGGPKWHPTPPKLPLPPGEVLRFSIAFNQVLDPRKTFGRRATSRYRLATGDTKFDSTRYAAVVSAGWGKEHDFDGQDWLNGKDWRQAYVAIAAKQGFLVVRLVGENFRPLGHHGKANPPLKSFTDGLVRLEHVTDVRRYQWVDRQMNRLVIDIVCNEFISSSGKTKSGPYVISIHAPNSALDKVDRALEALIAAARPSGGRRRYGQKHLTDNRPVPPDLFVSSDIHLEHLAEKVSAVHLDGSPFTPSPAGTIQKITGLQPHDHGLRWVSVFQCQRRERPKTTTTTKKADWPRGAAPRAGFIANSHEFEKFMATWMQWLGWDDASVMPKGPDGGVDVTAKGAKGQAKYWDHSVGIEEVQRHNGVCEGIPKHGRVFLAKNGYTKQALQWAETHDLPLFEMKAGSKDAQVAASTKMAQKLLKVGAKAL